MAVAPQGLIDIMKMFWPLPTITPVYWLKGFCFGNFKPAGFTFPIDTLTCDHTGLYLKVHKRPWPGCYIQIKKGKSKAFLLRKCPFKCDSAKIFPPHQ